jgi:DNA-binding MurR/RpiR family transcriptional regulator
MVNMNVRLNLADTARELSALLEEKQSYEKVIRETRWMEGPIAIVANGGSNPAGLAAARAFEWLLGVTVSVCDVAEFGSYMLPSLRPRSVLIAVSPSGEDKDLLEIVRKARQSGSTALALTRSRESRLAGACRGAFVLHCAEEAQPAARTAFLEHAALLYVACLAADIFNPRHPLAGSWEREFAELPNRLQWVHAHLSDAGESFAEMINHARHTVVIGGGLYYASALQAARLGWQLSNHYVQIFGLYDLLGGAPMDLGEADVALVASGSTCRVKKAVHAVAAKLEARNVRILSITDNNDQELVQLSSLAMLVPRLCEISGSLLQGAVLQWIILRQQVLLPDKSSTGNAARIAASV